MLIWKCVICFIFTLGRVESGNVDDMKRLHRALLENYNPDIRPCLDFKNPTSVSATLHLSTIMDLDIKNQVMKLIGFISFVWPDELLRWNETSYGDITDILLPEKKVWKPDVAIYNSVDERVFLGREETLVTINSTGAVRWEPVINLGLVCQVDISQYPFDQNICIIKALAWMNDNTSVNLMPSQDAIAMDELIPNGQFWITGAGTETNFTEILGKFYHEIHFRLLLKRRPNYLILTLLVPVTLLAVLCAVSFLLSPEEPEKVSVAITVLLSFTVFLGVVDNVLPENSDNMALIVIYVVLLLVLSFLCVAGNVVVVVIYKRDVKKWRHVSAAMIDSHLLPANGQLVPSGTPRHVKTTKGPQINDAKSSVHCSPTKLENPDSPYKDPTSEKVVQEENVHSAEGKKTKIDLSRAHRLNRYCLILNTVVLSSIVIAFFVLMMHLMVPITMLAVMCAIPFFLSPEEPEKLMVSITLLLSFTVLTDYITGKLPQKSDKVSTIVWYMTSLFVQAFIGVICNAFVLMLHELDMKRAGTGPTGHRKRSFPAAVTVATVEASLARVAQKTTVAPCAELNHVAVSHMIVPESTNATSRAYKANQCLIVINITILIALSATAWIQMLL